MPTTPTEDELNAKIIAHFRRGLMTWRDLEQFPRPYVLLTHEYRRAWRRNGRRGHWRHPQ